jgi:glutamine amidotransferase
LTATRVAIVDYGVGNLHSARNALELVGAEVMVTSRAEEIADADRLVLPGVGAFGECAKNLRASGLTDAIDEHVHHRGRPLFGICVGFQLLSREGHEMGVHPGLGWLPATVRKLETGGLKIPHVGWNEIDPVVDSVLFDGLRRSPTFYFTHSYAMVPDEPGIDAAFCHYGERFTAAVLKDNVFATQFHPEKSQENGLKILENFLRWNP